MSTSVSPATAAAPVEQFFELAQAHLQAQTLIKLVLAHHVGEDSTLQRIIVRPVVLKNQPNLSFVYRHQTRDITKNWPLAQGLTLLRELVGRDFRNAHILTPSDDIQLAISKKGKPTLRQGKAELTAPAAQEHNRQKHRHIEQSRPFLHALGVTDAKGDVIPAMSRKWKQINKFIEVFESALQASQLKERTPVSVMDFGSGKGYLTFAIHDHLRHTLGREASVTGVELRQDMVELCNGAARKLQLEGLGFDHGDVRDYPTDAVVNVMIALHACDIATDYAIHMGIRAGADIIMCSPCCHKQIRPQLLSPHPLRPILQHGVHLGQEAEMLTDGLRALLLDACGYDTQVFEFISLEHTNKNKMILAVRRENADPTHTQEVRGQIRDIKAFYGIQEQCLETLLQADALLA